MSQCSYKEQTTPIINVVPFGIHYGLITAKSAVSPSVASPSSLPEKDDDSVLGSIEEQTNLSSIHQLRRMTLADIAPRYAWDMS